VGAKVHFSHSKEVIGMTKPEMINAVAQRTGMKKKDAGQAIGAVLDTIVENIRKKQPVALVGFGTFDVRKRAERMGRNPRTGERIRIPATTVCIFRPGRRLREAVGR